MTKSILKQINLVESKLKQRFPKMPQSQANQIATNYMVVKNMLDDENTKKTNAIFKTYEKLFDMAMEKKNYKGLSQEEKDKLWVKATELVLEASKAPQKAN